MPSLANPKGRVELSRVEHMADVGTRHTIPATFRNVKDDTSGNERFNESWTYKGRSLRGETT